MSLRITARDWLRVLCLSLLVGMVPLAAQEPGSPTPTAGSDSAVNAAAAVPSGAEAGVSAPLPPAGEEPVVAEEPMRFDAEGTGVHGQLVVAQEILSPDTRMDLVYAITAEPKFGRVGLAGGADDADFFQNKTSRLGYFAYRPQDGYEGEDAFEYSVRNETNGLTFQGRVVIKVTPPPPVVMDRFEVGAGRIQASGERTITIRTRPNLPVTQKLPSHEDFQKPADRLGANPSKLIYGIDDEEKPKRGTARLDPATGVLSYAPDPGFIGEERFKYFTVDENNPQFGAENRVTIVVEPIRNVKRVSVDRSRSREVDLVFVINNSPSMAPHQSRIAENLSRFRELFHRLDLDYRIGVLTTDFVNADPGRDRDEQTFYKQVRGVQLDKAGKPVLDRRGRPKTTTKRVASNGTLVTLSALPQPWVTPKTPDAVFAELVKVGTNGDSNRTAFTSVYNFVAGYHNQQHTFLRPDATTIVVFFMDEEETRMALWKEQRDGTRVAEWIENGKLPDLLKQYNARNPKHRQTLDGYINYWVLRPFIIVKGNKRGKLEMHAVVSPKNISHRRAAELTGGSVLNIESDFSGPLAALGDRIANTVSVALDPVESPATLHVPSIRVLVDGQPVKPDAQNGWVYDARTHSIRFVGAAKDQAFLAKIDITYEEHQ